MNMAALRASDSFYGDSPSLSRSSFDNENASRFNSVGLCFMRFVCLFAMLRKALMSIQVKQPAPFANDPVAMYLLVETAMGDSLHYGVLSLEEVDRLKTEQTALGRRLESTRRKLALEQKLRDAARSLTRLDHSRSRFDSGYRDDAPDTAEPSMADGHNEELAISTRKCDELDRELRRLELRSQEVERTLLQHTAGVLQMTHKGLKKNVKQNGTRHMENSSTIDDFDDRSLYKGPPEDARSLDSAPVDLNAVERRLQGIGGRMRQLVSQTNSADAVGPLPQSLTTNGAPKNRANSVEAHLAYIENGLNALSSQPALSASVSSSPELEAQVVEINSRLQNLVALAGSSPSPRMPTDASDQSLASQIAFIHAALDNLQIRIDSLVEQKGILTTQIQQQRLLNSKSDSERDAHIADLSEQLAHARKELELSERQGQATRDELELVQEQLAALRNTAMDQQNEIAALADSRQARPGEEEVEAMLAQVRADAQAQQQEISASLSVAQEEIGRLQLVVDQLHDEVDARTEEVTEARDSLEQERLERSQLELTVQQARADGDARLQEVSSLLALAEEEVARLQAALSQAQKTDEAASLRIQEAADARAAAESNAARLQAEVTELESAIVRAQTELTVAKAELDGAYGTRAERAAEVAANPVIQREIDMLRTRNAALSEELAALQARPASANDDLQQRAATLEKELRETIDDYEAMTKASIEFEKERERLESLVDDLRDRCEQLETQLSEERINGMGVHSPMAGGREGGSETTSTMVLKNEFKKMMRDTRTENMKILRVSKKKLLPTETLISTS